MLDSTDRFLSKMVSQIRQPIESLFNWLEEKTKIQIASKIRSYDGLMVLSWLWTNDCVNFS